MRREVRREIRLLLRWPLLAGAAALIVLPSAVTLLFVVRSYVLVDGFDLYGLIQSGVVPLLFPLLAAAVAAVPFSAELRHRYLAATRTRIEVRRYLLAKAVAAAVVTFVVFAVATAAPMLIAFEVAPRAGWVTFDPTTWVDPPPLTGRQTFTQAFAVGPWAYALLYSGWVGLNAVLYALVPLLLLTVVRNAVVALTAPFLAYHVSSFVVAVAGLEQFSPASTVFPFNLTQQPLWTVLVPFTVLLLITVGLALRVSRTAPDNHALS